MDTVRQVKAFEAIVEAMVNAVLTESQRTKGTKVTLTLDIAATSEGFA